VDASKRDFYAWLASSPQIKSLHSKVSLFCCTSISHWQCIRMTILARSVHQPKVSHTRTPPPMVVHHGVSSR
jgi:hypothetical protein